MENLDPIVMVNTPIIDPEGKNASIFGAGTIISPKGLVLTNYHLSIGNGTPMVTRRDWSRWPARLLAADPFSDIALLKIGALDLPFYELGDSSLLEPGQEVSCIGHPGMQFFAVRSGRIFGVKNCFFSTCNIHGNEIKNPIETCSLNFKVEEGDCGGPVLQNEKLMGVLIGSMPVIGQSFFIPVNSIKTMIAAYGGEN